MAGQRFAVTSYEFEQQRLEEKVDIAFTFFVKGPLGDHPFTLAITWASGNTATLESGENLLPFEEDSPTRLTVPMTLGNVPANSTGM